MPVAIVTGSSRGIGRAIAERLGSRGTEVVVNYNSSHAAAEEVVTAIETNSGDAIAVPADVTQPEQLRGLFDTAAEHYGGIDILVHNAGTAVFTSVAETSDRDFDLLLATNIGTTFRALREAANRLRDGGRVVFISSGVASTHRPGSGIYAASKAAGEELVRVLARELAPRGITANNVRPGAIRTEALAATRSESAIADIAESTPLGRIGEPDDIADIVAFLVSEEARWVTGETVRAGGGLF